MTTKDYCSINFTGITHDHSLECRGELPPAAANDDTDGSPNRSHEDDHEAYCSAIPILKQHPMYDCLVLVRKYRNCLAGYSLEFPVDKIREHERLPTNESAHHQLAANDGGQLEHEQQRDRGQEHQRAHSRCSQRRLVSRFLDGDDPMYRRSGGSTSLTSSLSQGHLSDSCAGSDQGTSGSSPQSVGGRQANGESPCAQDCETTDARLLFMGQTDDRGDQCHLVHVPINGLLDRLESYTRNGIAVDSRVYAFAMGLKTAERMITTKSVKELHETPI